MKLFSFNLYMVIWRVEFILEEQTTTSVVMFIGVIFLEISDIFRNSSNGDRFRKGENNDEGQEQNGQERERKKKIKLQPTLISWKMRWDFFFTCIHLINVHNVLQSRLIFKDKKKKKRKRNTTTYLYYILITTEF